MAKLFSEEWTGRLADTVRADGLAQRHLRGFDADFQYVVTPAPARGVVEQHAFGIHFGDCASHWQGIRLGAPFTVTVGYELFHGAMVGNVDPLKLLRSRGVSIQGSLTRLLRHGRGIARVLQIARDIPATAAGEFPDIEGHPQAERSAS